MKKVYSLKKALVLAVAIFLCQCAFSQSENLYQTAFRYVRDLNKGRELFAGDTLVSFPLYAYKDELSGYWHKTGDATETIADSSDWDSEADKIVQLDFLKQLRTKGAKPAHIIYFSRVCLGNLLIAEAMPEKHDANLSHEDQAAYNNCTQYLFIFDENGKIKKVFVHPNEQYN